MNKTESYCYQKYKSSSNNSCVIKEKNIVGKNLLEGTYFDGNGIPKMIGITKAEYLEYKQLQQENKQLKIQISARETLCEEYEQLINTILNFSFFKEECPLNFEFEDNSKEDKAQNIFYTDEYCENNCNDNYKDCWLKYFKELQKTKGDE